MGMAVLLSFGIYRLMISLMAGLVSSVEICTVLLLAWQLVYGLGEFYAAVVIALLLLHRSSEPPPSNGLNGQATLHSGSSSSYDRATGGSGRFCQDRIEESGGLMVPLDAIDKSYLFKPALGRVYPREPQYHGKSVEGPNIAARQTSLHSCLPPSIPSEKEPRETSYVDAAIPVRSKNPSPRASLSEIKPRIFLFISN